MKRQSQYDYSDINSIADNSVKNVQQYVDYGKAVSEAEKEHLANVKTKNDFLHDSLMFANTPEKWNYTKDYLLKNDIIDKSAYKELGEYSPDNWAKHFADLSSHKAELKYHTDLLEGKTKEQAIASKDMEIAKSSLEMAAKLNSQVTRENYHVLKPLIEKALGHALPENYSKNAVPNLPDLNLETAEKKADIAKKLSDAGAGTGAADSLTNDFINDQNPKNTNDGIIVEDLEPFVGTPGNGNVSPEPQPVLIDEEPKLNSKPDKLPPAELPYKPLFNGAKTDAKISPLNGSPVSASFSTKTKYGLPLSREQVNAIQNSDPRLQKDVLAKAGLNEAEINYLNSVLNGDAELNGKNGQFSNPARRDFVKKTYRAAVDPKDINDNLYRIKNDLIKDYTSGDSSNKINGVNKTYETLGLLSEAAKDLAQGNMIPSNRVANYLKLQTGKDGQVDFNTYKNALTYELNQALQSASPSDTKFLSDNQLTDKNYSPKQLDTAVKALAKVTATQAEGLFNKWNRTINPRKEGHEIDPRDRLDLYNPAAIDSIIKINELPDKPSIRDAISMGVSIPKIKEILSKIEKRKKSGGQ